MGSRRKGNIFVLDTPATAFDPLVQGALQALARLGGAAHREVVVGAVLEMRGVVRLAGIEAARGEILAAMEAFLDTAPAHAVRPFGAGSRRWALTEAGRRRFAAV
jgi:hypothetical protein